MISQDRIGRIADMQDLSQLLARYGRAVDWLDIPSMKACFHDDAVLSFGDMAIPAPGFCDFWAGQGAGFKARHHHMGLPVIDFTGPDSAFVEVPAVVAGTHLGGGARLRDFIECNRYLFDCERRDGVWRVAKGRIFVTWSQGSATPAGIESGGAQHHDVDRDNPFFVPLGNQD